MAIGNLSGRKDIVQLTAELLDQLPPLPESWKRIFIKVYPWLLIIQGIWTGSGVLPTFLRFFAITPFTFSAFYPYGAIRSGFLWIVIAGIDSVIALLAGFRMLKMSRSGWRLAMIGVILGLFISLISGSGLGLIFSLIALYFLWQVKAHYF